jgi:hypothetical protein
MPTISARSFAIAALAAASIFSHFTTHFALSQQAAAGSPAVPTSKAIGAIKAINGATLTLSPDAGPEVTIAVLPATQIVQVEPGAKTLSDATTITLQDLQIGDRIRVTGKMADPTPNGGQSLQAAKIIAIKHADLEARHQQQMQDWQKRGVDGLATAVDPAAGTVTLTIRNKPLVLHTSSATVIRRYPPDSVKFDDARPSTLQAIHPGDQVRARGDRSPEGTELTAEEIVSGAFRNIAGTVNSVDASSFTLSVHDLLSKKNITIRITPDSQLRKLPPEMAQRIAARLKGAAGASAGGSRSSSASTPGAVSADGPPPHSWANKPASEASPGAVSGAPRGAPDLQQILSRLPTVPLSDLHNGDAVVLVSTEGTENEATAITLLSGVEPILQAAPAASSSSILSPWSLGAPSGDAGGP